MRAPTITWSSRLGPTSWWRGSGRCCGGTPTRSLLGRQPDLSAGDPVIRAGALEIALARRSVTAGGRAVKLTPTEYELLRYLALHAGKAVTHTTLLRQVWGEYAVGDKYNTRYVVGQIRKKLGDDPANPRYIVNEPGVGYRLEAGT